MQTPSSSLAIDKIFVLTVKTFTDRIAHVQAEMDKHQLPFAFILEHDIPDIAPETLQQSFTDDHDMPLAACSLDLKHIHAWRACVENGWERILVLEDDAVLHKQFVPEMRKVLKAADALAPGYYIFLGGANATIPKNFHTQYTDIIPLPGATTEGYIVDQEACRRRLKWLEQHKIGLPADYLINQIDAATGIQQYWSYQYLVEQGSMYGLFDSALDRKRKKRSRFENQLRYHLVVFKRRVWYKWIYRLRKTLLRM